jgi:hypothetical protein
MYGEQVSRPKVFEQKIPMRFDSMPTWGYLSRSLATQCSAERDFPPERQITINNGSQID